MRRPLEISERERRACQFISNGRPEPRGPRYFLDRLLLLEFPSTFRPGPVASDCGRPAGAVAGCFRQLCGWPTDPVIRPTPVPRIRDDFPGLETVSSIWVHGCPIRNRSGTLGRREIRALWFPGAAGFFAGGQPKFRDPNRGSRTTAAQWMWDTVAGERSPNSVSTTRMKTLASADPSLLFFFFLFPRNAARRSSRHSQHGRRVGFLP